MYYPELEKDSDDAVLGFIDKTHLCVIITCKLHGDMQVNLSLIMTQPDKFPREAPAKCFTNTGKGLVLSAGREGGGKGSVRDSCTEEVIIIYLLKGYY